MAATRRDDLPVDDVPAGAPRALLDHEADQRLAADGYVVLPGRAADEVAWVREIAVADLGDEHQPGRWEPPPLDWPRQVAPGATWRIGINEADAEHRAAREEQVAPLWERLVPELFVDHRLLFTSFLTKHPGDDGVLPLHQDPTVVDERVHRSYTLWIALDDMGPELGNGPLHVLAGSHEAGREWRGTFTTATYLPEAYRLWPLAEPLAVRAGDVVVLDSRVVHGSPPNGSERSRAAVAGVVVPGGAPVCHVLGRGEDEVVLQEVDHAFYRRESPASLHASPPEDLPVLSVEPRAPEPTTVDDLIARARRRRPSWLRRAARRLSPR